MSEWREIGALIADRVTKEPTHIQIAIGLCVAFTLLMILEGLRASFFPRRGEKTPKRAAPRLDRALFRSAPANASKRLRNAKRHERIVKRHRALKPVIRRPAAATKPETPATGNLPQVAGFGD